MNWFKYALMWNDPQSNVEHEIFQDLTGRSGKEIAEIVEQNYDMIAQEAKRRIDLGIDLENIVEEMTKDIGRNFGFSPDKTLEWSTLWSEMFEVIQPLSGEGQDWRVIEFGENDEPPAP